MMQTAVVQKISEQNSLYKATLDRAYMIGYTDAINQERSRRRAARERRERKKYFAMQKLNGVALLIFTAVAIKILEGDATIAFITVTFNGTCEDAMRYMINRMAAVPLLEVAPGIGDATKITFQATYKNVLTYLSKIARYCELGFRVVPDFKGKKMTFETYKGIDRTKKQGTKPRVIFSESYNNLNRAKHTYSDETAKTKIVVGGAGDGADRIYVTVGGGTGFDLREEFLDAKDINKDDFSTNAEYLEALRIRGEQYKAENAVIENIEAEVEAEVNFIYGTDYDLGDIVTVEKAKWNKVLNLRITELCEVYEYGGMYVVPTFGDALPTTINWDN